MTSFPRRKPVWLQSRWEQKKLDTVQRVSAAVEKLSQSKQRVTFTGIRDTVKVLYGVSISCNTIKQNQAAYEIYLASRQSPRAQAVREPRLQVLIARTSAPERALLLSKIARLRREQKDALIARVIELDKRVVQQKEVETRLRDEIISLSWDQSIK